jgi:hypothetical protein
LGRELIVGIVGHWIERKIDGIRQRELVCNCCFKKKSVLNDLFSEPLDEDEFKKDNMSSDHIFCSECGKLLWSPIP